MNRLYNDDLTKTEKHIAKMIINLGTEFDDLSIEAFASLAKVSPAMIVKYAKTCQFTGYKELKYYVQANRKKGTKINQDYREFQQTKIAGFFTYIENHPELVTQLAESINAAKYVIFYGHGPSLGVANYFANKLSAAAKKPVIVQSDEQMMELEIERAKAERLVILLSASLKTSQINDKIIHMNRTSDNYYVVYENNNYDLDLQHGIKLSDIEIDYDYHILRDRTLFFIFFELVFDELCEIVHNS